MTLLPQSGPYHGPVPTPDEPVLRLRVDLGYDGAGFAGWARQPGRRTVQGELETALGHVLRLPGPTRTVVAGRTDAGVHARGQVAHTDVPLAAWDVLAARPGFALHRLRSALPADVRVTAVAAAPEGFDARWSVTARRYAYRVSDDPAGPDPLTRGYVWHRSAPQGARLDRDAMNAAAAPLLGEHDFAAFCKRREGASTVRTLRVLRWRRGADGIDAGLVVMDVEADAFCHSMVRSLVGALVPVGQGRADVAAPGRLLAAGRRHLEPAPPHGLCLEAVTYPPDAGLAAAAVRARRVRGPLA